MVRDRLRALALAALLACGLAATGSAQTPVPAAQTEDAELAAKFAPLAKTLADNEQKIVAEFKAVQGQRVDIGGYYKADPAKTKAVLRPSPTFNAALAAARG